MGFFGKLAGYLGLGSGASAGLLPAAPGVDVAKTAPYASGGFAPTAPVPPPTKSAGSDGVSIFGGFLVSGERDPRLQGQNKWTTFDNTILNVAIVGSAVNIWTTLAKSVKWSATPNKRGGRDAEHAVEIVTEGLFEAQMGTPWRQVVGQKVLKKFRGFSLHEMLIRRRSDGRIVCGDLQDRPQWTIWRWNKPDEQSPWLGVEQLTRSGPGTYYIPRERLFYSVENALSPSPEGVGLLRMLAEPVRILELYQQWEGIGFQTDLRGIPLARAPLSKLLDEVDPSGNMTENERKAAVKASVTFLTDLLAGHNKRADQGVLIDSKPYTTKDGPQTPSQVAEWAFELVKGATSGMAEVGAAIARITRDVARVMNAEFMLLGDTGSGSDAMHEDKTEMFGLVADGALDDIADDAGRDIAARLVALNGLDPETCTPTIQHEPIARTSVDAACKNLMLMFQAGLDPRDPAINVLRGRMDLPDAPDIDERLLMLPRGTEINRLGPDGMPIAVGAPAAAPATPTQAPVPVAIGKPPRAAAKPSPDAPAASAPGKPGNVNADPGKPGAKPTKEGA